MAAPTAASAAGTASDHEPRSTPTRASSSPAVAMNGLNAPAAIFGTNRYSPSGRHRKGTYNSKVQARSRTAIPAPSASKTVQPVMATPSSRAPPGLPARPGSRTRGAASLAAPDTLEGALVRRGRTGPNGPPRPGPRTLRASSSAFMSPEESTDMPHPPSSAGFLQTQPPQPAPGPPV